MQDNESRSPLVRRIIEVKWIIVTYLAISTVCMSCGCLLGYRLNWILWRLNLR